jgi:hypothetical protein
MPPQYNQQFKGGGQPTGGQVPNVGGSNAPPVQNPQPTTPFMGGPGQPPGLQQAGIPGAGGPPVQNNQAFLQQYSGRPMGGPQPSFMDPQMGGGRQPPPAMGGGGFVNGEPTLGQGSFMDPAMGRREAGQPMGGGQDSFIGGAMGDPRGGRAQQGNTLILPGIGGQGGQGGGQQPPGWVMGPNGEMVSERTGRTAEEIRARQQQRGVGAYAGQGMGQPDFRYQNQTPEQYDAFWQQSPEQRNAYYQQQIAAYGADPANFAGEQGAATGYNPGGMPGGPPGSAGMFASSGATWQPSSDPRRGTPVQYSHDYY